MGSFANGVMSMSRIRQASTGAPEPDVAGILGADKGGAGVADRLSVTIFSDYVCPFCYLGLPVAARLQRELPEQVEVKWKAFELRPEPAPLLDPRGAYLARVWSEAVYPLAREPWSEAAQEAEGGRRLGLVG